MTGPPILPWVIAALFALSIAAQLHTGHLHLYMAPKNWQGVSKAQDPGRFWLFIIAETIALIGAICVGLFQ